MKALIACLLFVAAAQAVEWGNVKARFMTRETTGYRPLNSGRIIGGTTAERHQFPYQVALYLDGTSFCGGSIISDNVVMTAAHCVDAVLSFEIHFGAQNINNPGEPDRQIVISRDGVKHAAYNPNTINNDIGIVRLKEPVTGTGIAPIRLPSRSQQGELFVGTTARVSGWGRTSDSDPNISNALQFVDVVIMANAECARVYGADIINASKICIDTAQGSVGTCSGDSGGPLTITEADGVPTQIGIVSFGASDGCEAGYPAGLTRLTSFLDWLELMAQVTIRP